MDDQDLHIINQIFASQAWLVVREPICIQQDSSLAKGQIKIPTVKEDVYVEVDISGDFPLGKIGFICTNLRGYPHLMPSGLLCLTAAPAVTIEDRLLLELAKLKKWVEDYYLNEKVDSHFEYYNFPSIDLATVIFEEGVGKGPLKGNFGHFTFGLLQEYDLGDKKKKVWIATELGGRPCRWASTFMLLINQRFTGLWVYIKKPPLLNRRQTISKWEDLLRLMGGEQTKFLNDAHKKIRAVSGYSAGFLLMLGYDIPSPNGKTEINWEPIFIPFDDFPFSSQKLGDGQYGPKDIGKEIGWCKGQNASYERIFGRGRLSREFTEQKILIIGTGAIGSNLLEALIRGGCRFVDIRDGDLSEPGNVCRGQFGFKDSFTPKVIELFSSAIRKSPYLEIKFAGEVVPMRSKNPKYEELREALAKYRLIFDCSTNKYLSMMLDGMNLPGQVINLSITDQAKQFCVVTGIGNIHKIKSDLYNRIGGEKQEKFFVASGCWSPTFRASFIDINSLLMYALKEMNQRFETNLPIESFFIETGDLNKSVSYELNYNV